MRYDFKRILLIQFRPIGDVLLCTPLISMLRNHYPDAHIAFMVEPLPGQVLENNPDLDEIIYYRHKKDDIWGSFKFFRKVGKQKWDLAIDIYGTPGTAWATLFSRAKVRVGYTLRVRKYVYTHRVNHLQPERYSAQKKLALIKAVGIDEESPVLTLRLFDSECKFADDFFKENAINGDRFTVCFASAAKRPARAWRIDGWQELGDMLCKTFDANVIIVRGPGEEETAQTIADKMSHRAYIIPLTNLREMAAIIERSHLMVSNSSGPGHMAAAVGVPTITIHGPTTPLAWTYPDPNRHRYVRGDVPCIECNLPNCKYDSNAPEYMRCMDAVKAGDIVNEMKKIPELHSLLPANFVHQGRPC